MSAERVDMPDGGSVMPGARLRAVIAEQMAVGAVRRFLPVAGMSAGATAVTSGTWTLPVGDERSLVTDQSATAGVIELVGQMALTREQLEADSVDEAALAGARKLARSTAAIEDYLVVRGFKRSTAPSFIKKYAVDVSTRTPDDLRGLYVADSAASPIAAGVGDVAVVDLVTGIAKACKAMHEQGREGPYALVVSMPIHQLLRTRTRNGDVGTNLLPGDIEHVVGLRALDENKAPTEAGVLIALGGQPVELLTESESPIMTPAGYDGDGRHLFQLRHRFAVRIRDESALQPLKFKIGKAPANGKT